MEPQRIGTFEHVGALNVVGRWLWWQNALKGNFGQASESHPEQGYYRTRRKDGQWEPVAIWFDEESQRWLAYRAGHEARDVNELWVWCQRNPITHAAYEQAMAGNGFDDEPPPPIGDNSGEADPFDALRLELEGETEQLAAFMKSEVVTQEHADKVAIWSKRLGDIGKRAEDRRKTEKEPHLTAGREVDAKWNAVIDAAKDWTAKAKKFVEPFLIAKKREEQERAAAAQRAADELRRQARESDQRDEQARQELLRKAQEADRAAEVHNASAGRTGARVSVRVVKVGVVTDYAKAAAALVAMKHRDLFAEIDRLAKAAATKGMAFDGMEIREEERVV